MLQTNGNIEKNLLDLEILTHEEHKIPKQPLRGALQKWLRDKKSSSEA